MAKQTVYNYVKNITTSIKYAAMDKFEDLAPAPTEFIQTNASLFKDVVDFSKNYKTTFKNTVRDIKSSKIYDSADSAIKNVFSDLSSGKFYNKEREMKASAAMFGDDEDYSDFYDYDDMSIDDDSKFIVDSLDNIGEKSTNSLCNMMLKTADIVTKNNRTSTQLLYSQNTQLYNLVNRGMMSIAENTGNLLEFSNTVVRTHVDNATTYYKTSTETQAKQLELLQKIYDHLESGNKKKNNYRSDSELNYSSITSSGVVDIREYAKIIKKNAKNIVGSTGLDMLEGMDPASLVGAMTASPLKFVPKFIVNKMISETAEKTFQEFNDTFSGLFASMIMKFNDMADHSDNEIFKKIGEVLGIKTSLKTNLSTSNYDKGTMKWNGKANKALTEVIPTYLAKIESLLSGKSASIYDYENGRFISAKDIKSNFTDKLDSRAKSASSDMRSHFSQNMEFIQFNTNEEKDKLQKDIDNFFIALFKHGKIFNFNSDTIDSQYASYGVSSIENFRIIKNMFKNSPIGMQMMINNNILRERDSYNRMMQNLEAEGNDLSLMMFNNSGIMGEDDSISKARSDINKLEKYRDSLKYKSSEKYQKTTEAINKLKEKVRNSDKYIEIKKSTTNNFLNNYVDKKGHNVFWYLENILVAIKSSDFGSGDYSYIVPDENKSMKDYEEYRKAEANKQIQERNAKILADKDKFKYISYEDAQSSSLFDENTRIRKEAELKEEERKKLMGKYSHLLSEDDIDLSNETFKDRFNKAQGLGNKFNVIANALTDIVQKPMNAFSKLMHMADKKMYNIIYGGKIKTDDGKEVDGILGLMSYHVKNTFSDIKDWFAETFGSVFKLKDGKSKFDLEKIFGDRFSQFMRDTAKSFGGIGNTVGQGVQTFLDPILSRLVGKKTDSIDDIIINGKTLREYYENDLVDSGGKTRTDMQLLAKALNDISISGSDKKTIERQYNTREKYTTEVLNLFGKVTKGLSNDKSLKLDASDIKVLDDTIKEIFANMNISNMGKNTRELKNKVKSGQFFTLEDLFGKLIEDENGNLIHDENDENRIIKDKKLYSSFMKGMEKTRFADYRGTDKYNLENFFNQDFSAINDISDNLNDLLKEAEEFSKTNKAQFESEKSHQKVIVSNMERIVYLLSKIAKEDVPSNILDNINKEKEYLANLVNPIDGHAYGARYITKSGITAISKGEMVIPSDKNPFNPNRDKVNRAQEVANEKRIINAFMKGKKPGMNYAGTVENATALPITQEEVDYVIDENYHNQRRQEIEMSSSDNKSHPIKEGIMKAASILGENLNKAVTSLTGRTEELKNGANSKLEKAINDAIENSSVYGPRMLAGGIAGAFSFGALFAGAVNPIIGAAIGAGTGLLSSSDKFREWMFGVKENGEFVDGIIPSNITNWFAKNGKTIGLSTLGGSVLGSLTGHPLIGMALGAGAGLLNSSEKFRDYMFGPEGVIDPEKQKKILKFAKTTAIGTIATNLISPGMGLLPKMIIGSIGGMIAQSDKFQEFIFGRKDDTTGKYEHGLLPAIRHVTVDPLSRLIHGIEERSIAFIRSEIVQPIKIFFEPLGRAKNKVGELMGKMFEILSTKIGEGLSRSFSSAFKPITDAIRNSAIGQAIGKVFGGAKKFLGTLVNPLKWMELAGKGMGNLFGRLGWMNNLTDEEYDKYSIDFFGKKLLARRKGQNTIDEIANSGMSKKEMSKLIEDLKLVNSSKKNARKNQDEATNNLNKKLNDLFGGSKEGFEAAASFAKNINLNDENSETQLNDLMIAAYKNKYVGKDVNEARKNLDPSINTLRSIIINSGYSRSTADNVMSIINNSTNIEDAMDKLNQAGIVISKPKIGLFKKEFKNYKDLNNIINGHSNTSWERMSRDDKLKTISNDPNFDMDNAKKAFKNTVKEYQLSNLAVTDSAAARERLESDLKRLGINPDKLNSKQILEILESQYKFKTRRGLWGTEESQNDENIDENTQAIHNVSTTIENKADEMILLLRNISEHLGNKDNLKELDQRSRYIDDLIDQGIDPVEARLRATNEFGDTDTIMDSAQYKISKKSYSRNKKVYKFSRKINDLNYMNYQKPIKPELTGDDSVDSQNYADYYDKLRLYNDNKDNTTLHTKIKSFLHTDLSSKDKDGNKQPTGLGARFKDILTHRINIPKSHAYGSGIYDNDGLAAVSKDELIIDASKYGYNNGINTNKIFSFANGTPEMDSISLTNDQKEQLEKDRKEQEEKQEKRDKLQEEMNKNMEYTRKSFVSDDDLKKSGKKGKVPSFLTKIGNGMKNIFNPKKLFRKAGLIALGAGALFSPLLSKALEAIVPFITGTVIPKITEALPNIFEQIAKLVPSLINLVTECLPKLVSTIATQTLPAILELLPSFIEGTGKAISNIVDAVPKLLDPILKMLPAAVRAVFIDLLPTLIEMIPDLILTITDNIGPLLGAIVQGVATGIESIIVNLPNILVSVFGGVENLFKGLLGLEGSGLRKPNKLQKSINRNISMTNNPIKNLSAAGRGKSSKKKKNIFQTAASGITSIFKNLFKKKDTKSNDENANKIESYADGKSYLDGKQINPLMAHISQNSTKYMNKSFNIPMIDRGITLGSDGCGVMSGAMVINSLNGEDTITPEKVATSVITSGSKAVGGGVKSKFFGPYFKKFGIDTEYYDLTDEKNASTSRNNIINALKENKPVILMGNDPEDSGNTPFPNNNHYVVATGLSDDGSKIILNDPYNTSGGDVYNTNEVLDKTIVGIKATKNHQGLNANSALFAQKTEANNTYRNNSNKSISIKNINTNTPTTNLGKQFDPIAYQDLGNYNTITEEEMNNFINYWYNINGHDAFVGHGDVFIEAAKKTGLDPRYILAHAAVESGWGTSRIAREKGNYFGITAYNDSAYSSATKFDNGLNGIIQGAQWIKDHFYDRGQTNLYDMIYKDPNHRYAVFNDGSPNSAWIDSIASIMRKAPSAYTNVGETFGSGTSNPFDLYTNTHGITGGEKNELAKLQEQDVANTGIRKSITSYKYVSPTIDGYFDSISPSYVKLSENYSTDKDDPKYSIMNAMYGNNYSYDPYASDSTQFTIDDTVGIMRSIYKSYAKKSNPNIADSSLDSAAIENVKSAEYADGIHDKALKGIALLHSRLADKAEGSLAPMIWKDLNIDLEGQENDITRALINEFVYNPSILDDDTRLGELALKYHEDEPIETRDAMASAFKANVIDPLVEQLKTKGVQLTYDQTKMLYGTPAVYKKNGKLIVTPYGSSKYINPSDHILSKYSHIFKPSFDAITEINNIQDATAEQQANVLDKYTQGVDNTINGESTTTEEPQGLLAIFRGISNTFAQIFDRIGELLWGIPANGGGIQHVGSSVSGSAHNISNDSKNNIYGLTPNEDDKVIVTLKKRPDMYANYTTKNSCEILKAYKEMTVPNGPNHIGWLLSVYGRIGADKYLISQGFMITIPKSDFISGYDSVPNLVSDEAAADNYFINMLKANGAPGTYKSSSGPARDTLFGANRLHTGIDYSTSGIQGAKIFSPVSGEVVTNKSSDSAGNYVVVKDDGSVDGTQRYHRFMHMRDLGAPPVGSHINAGDYIGDVGNTGQSSGAHLHYDIADYQGSLGGYGNSSESAINSHYVNPNTYLSAYFDKNGYPQTNKKTYDTVETTANKETEVAKGGYSGKDNSENMYKAVLQMLTYLIKISDNTSLIGEIVSLLTQIETINNDKSLTNIQKHEKKTQVRLTLADKAKQYSRILNSANNETTGNSDLVKSLQFIASQ